MPDTFYVPMPRSPATELADDIDHLETSIPVLDTDVFPDPPNLATIGAGQLSRSVYDAGVATSAAASELTDDAKTWEVDEHSGRVVRIISGTGAGQRRIITTNSADTLTVTVPWTTEPDGTSDYDIVSALAYPQSETIIYTGKATGALTGVTRGYEPEHSSRNWSGGTPIARVLAVHDIVSLQNRLEASEGDIHDIDILTTGHTGEINELTGNQDRLLKWHRNRRVWGAL